MPHNFGRCAYGPGGSIGQERDVPGPNMNREESIWLLKEVQHWLGNAMEQALALPENTVPEMRKKRLLCRELRGRCHQLRREYQKFASFR